LTGNGPLISVIMPVYNAAPFLEEAIRSISRQTERNWEFIIVDDGSTDETGVILERALKADDRIRIVINDQNIGLTRSLNRALDLASGEFIARQDGDDASLPERFKKQIACLRENPKVAAVGCAFEVMDVDGTELSVSRPPEDREVIRRLLKKRNPLAHGSLMFRKAALDSCGRYNEFFRTAQDFDLLRRLAMTNDIVSLPEVLYRLRLAPASVSLAQNARRYHLLKALHLIKSDRTIHAREEIRKAGAPSLHSLALFFFSWLPGSLRSALLSGRRLLERF
jgi:glycosyltransferase involved in cell wall biosynthesis